MKAMILPQKPAYNRQSGGNPATPQKVFDVFIIGGGINGCGIARDLAGRGVGVALAEMGDLASATSSASTKLFHGGLRYLEYFEFRLVREALREREVLLAAMPHISWPMRFILPYHRDMRFEKTTPLARVMAATFPWLKGRRPRWFIRLGLFLYDHMGGRRMLPPTRNIDFTRDESGKVLKPGFRHGYEYSDCWVEDSRLVVLNARDAAQRGARIMPRMKITAARRGDDGLWYIEAKNHQGKKAHFHARALVNAAGPWAHDIITGVTGQNAGGNLRLVRGSHIIVPRLYNHDRAYFLQGRDGRIVFAIPYEGDFTLIGTTDIDHASADTKPVCTDAEKKYLCDFVSEYFAKPVRLQDIVATYSGVRPLYDETPGAATATATSRDYSLRVDSGNGGGAPESAPLLNVFGGKITTYRKLAEEACAALAPYLENMSRNKWTAGAPLPGGDFPTQGFDELVREIETRYGFLQQRPGLARRLVRAYGTETRKILKGRKSIGDLGRDFGCNIFAAEIDRAIANEWVMNAEDFLWRRTRLGLRLDEKQTAALDAYIKKNIRLRTFMPKNQ